MNRRTLLATLALGGCSVLPARPYLERRQWPLEARRPTQSPPRPGAPTLLVRTLRAAPGLDTRGLRSIQPDGSVRTDAYEEWSVPPAEAVEEQLRRWMSDSGLFATVLAPGSRLRADFVLEGELLALASDVPHAVSRVALGLALLDTRSPPPRLRLQAEIRGQAPLPAETGGAVAQSSRAALAVALAEAEARVAQALA